MAEAADEFRDLNQLHTILEYMGGYILEQVKAQGK